MSRNREGICFALADLTKTVHPGKKTSIYYPSLKNEERLGPVNALNEYLRRTQPRREVDQTKTRLFLSVVKPPQAGGKIYHCKMDKNYYS